MKATSVSEQNFGRLLSESEVPGVDLASLVGTSMGKNAATFPSPNPPLANLASLGSTMSGFMQNRADLLLQAQTLTIKIRDARNAVEAALNSEAGYAEDVVKNMPDDQAAAAITSIGLTVAATTGTPVGAMPKVDGLTATQGDADGEIDLSWNTVKRGLQNFLIELIDDPAGQAGWRYAANSRKSSAIIKGLTSGKRYWFRVTAEGAAGPGPASDPATKVAP
jgi:fibronectin type III domain protein